MTGARDARLARAFTPSRHVVVVLASAAVVAAAFAVVAALASNSTNTALAAWIGGRMLSSHALIRSLGTETFTAHGAPVYVGWLGALFAYFAATHPATGIALATACFLAAAVIALSRTAAREGGASALVIVAVLCTLAGTGAISSAPTTLNWLFISLALIAVERGAPRAVYSCVVLTALWCNVDALGMLVPGILLLAAAGARITDASYSARTALYVRAAALSVFATALTPALLELPRRAATYLHIDPTYGDLRAWQPPLAAAHAYPLAVVSLLLAAALFGTWRRERAFDAFLVVAAAIYGLLNVANLELFVLAAAPVVVPAALRAMGLASRSPAGAIAVLLALSACADVVLWNAVLPGARLAVAAARAPGQLIGPLASDGLAHRVFCSSIDLCDAVVASGNPRLRVFMDGREAAYPAKVIADQRTIAEVGPAWRSRLSAWNVDAVIVRRNQPLSEVLELLPASWHEIARSGTAMLFVRRGAS